MLKAAEAELYPIWQDIDEIVLYNQEKVLSAFQSQRIGAHHFQQTTGYGYNDPGREALESLFAKVFGGEAALVRQQFASGTHAITCCLRGVLRPGDELIFGSGLPYDTLQSVLGINADPPVGHLGEYGITTKVIPLRDDGGIDLEAIVDAISSRTRMIAFQRSCGYAIRPSLSIKVLEETFRGLRKYLQDNTVIFVDNCYGEFVEEKEPLEVGADLIAGSLIKNPGGGLAPAGGYVVGKAEFVEMVAAALFAPGIGLEVGASLANPRPFFQGLFEAPARVGEMLKSVTLWAEIFRRQGFKVSPLPTEKRTDTIQRIEFLTPERLSTFCQILQASSPVDSHVTPIAAHMPGYDHPVIMAAGTFISGATSELSVDAPFIPPYRAYLQGGLTLAQTKIAVLHLLEKWRKKQENFDREQESHAEQ